jgi:hypothetical protein
LKGARKCKSDCIGLALSYEDLNGRGMKRDYETKMELTGKIFFIYKKNNFIRQENVRQENKSQKASG